VIPGVLNPSQTEIRPEAHGFRALLVWMFLVWHALLSGCAPGPPELELPEPAGPPVPSIVPGELSREGRREARRLLLAAQDSLQSGGYSGALAAADSVISGFPELPGSARALWIKAQAHEALGNPVAAAEAGASFAALLDPEHPLLPPAVLLQARALQETASAEVALEALLSMPPGTPDSILGPGRELMRTLAPVIPIRDLEQEMEALSPAYPLRGVIATELAMALYLQGEEDEAVRLAESVLQGALESREEALARAVVQGRLEEALGIPMNVGLVIPRTEVSPNLAQYGEWFQEGVQVALEAFREELPRPVRLEVLDDGGTPLGARTAIRTLEEMEAMAALGFMGQGVLEEAAQAREGGMPLIPPFSFLPQEEAPNVYSLSGPDLGEALRLARIARDLELNTVAIVRPETMEARLNAQAFSEEFQALGGTVPREIVFDSGGTFFQPQFQQVEEILPDGMFLPLRPRDIQLLAPQVTFYGLDTLGVQMLGTSGWTDPAVVQGVDSRHTDGVVAATARLSQDETEAFRRFREAYEAQFQKSLRNDVPAFGYDAAAVLLEALKAGPRNREELVAALEEIRDLPGATGVLNVQSGRITREPLLVRIQDHELIYITRRDP